MALTKPKLSQNIDTDISVFSDPILVLHQGASVADVDVGFLMNRSNGLTANAAVIWQESSKSFVHILTNSSGVANSNLAVQSYANVSVGNVLLINGSGIYVDGTLGTPGQVLASDGSKSYWAAPGGFTGGTVTGPAVFQSNLVISNTTTSTSNVTGALVVLGGIGVSGNIFSNSAIYTTTGIYWTGNGQAFTSTTLANTAEITANLTSGQNVGLSLTTTGVAAGNYGSATSIPTIVVDSKGRITSLTSNAVSTTINLAGGSGSGSVAGGGTLTVNGTTNQITTSISASTITIAFAQDITAPGNVTVVGNLVVQGNTTTLNTETLTVEDLNITLANGAATAAAADGAGLTVAGANARLLYQSSTDSWVFDKGVFASGNLVANSGTASTSVSTGALVVVGGAGVSGALYIGNTGDVSANIGTLFNGNVSTNANLGAFQTFSNANAAAQGTSINTINANIGAYQTYANANVVAIQANLGAYQIYANANVTAIQANIGAFQTYANTKIGTNTNSNLVVVATTTSTSTTTGALVVAGGAGIAGNVTTANLFATGVFIGSGSAISGLFWSANNQPVAAQPGGSTTNIQYNNGGVFAGASNFTYTAASGNVVVGTTTASTSSATGALVVAGGVGVAGNINIGGSGGNAVVTTGDIYTTANIEVGNNVRWAANGQYYLLGYTSTTTAPLIGTTDYGANEAAPTTLIDSFGVNTGMPVYDMMDPVGYIVVADFNA